MNKYFALIFFFILSCYNSNNAKTKNINTTTDSLYVYVNSKIVNKDVSYWQLQYSDAIGIIFQYHIKDTTGLSSIPFPSKSVITIRNSHFRQGDEILVYPGDTIYIDPNGKEFVATSSGRGKYSISYSKFMNDFHEKSKLLFDSLNNISNAIYDKSFVTKTVYSLKFKKNLPDTLRNKLLDSLISFNEHIYEIQKSYLKKLSTQNLLMDDYEYWIEKKIFYSFLSQQCKFIIDRHCDYYSYINEYDFVNDSLVWIYFPDYRNFLETVLLQNVILNNENILSLNKVSPYKEAYNKSENYIRGKSLEYIKFYCLQHIKDEVTTEDFNKVLSAFNASDIDSLYKKYINDYLGLGNDILNNSSETFLIDMEKNKISLEELFKKYKNYVLYIDFWASWCNPCRIMLPSSIQKSKLVDNKKIKFLYFSIEEDFNKWKSAALIEGISSADKSFLILNPQNSPFLKELNVQSIPRYIIVANGKIVYQNAPDPDNPNLKELLNNLAAGR